MPRHRGPTWKPTAQDYWRIFGEQNPWHGSGRVPDDWAKEVERPLAKHLAPRLRDNEPRRFQLILGPRRVGKTTSMYQTVKQLLGDGIPRSSLWWLRLDHPLLMEVPLDYLVRMIMGESGASHDNPAYLLLDEISYSDKWDLHLKTFYDDSYPVRVVGTSSSTAALRERRLESGVGRWEEQYLAPYLFPEFLNLVGRSVPIPVEDNLSLTIAACIKNRVAFEGLADLRRRFLLTGGFPELLISSKGGDYSAVPEASLLLQSQRILRNDAVERAIYKDIPQAFGVDNPLMLERTLYTLAGQVSGILSPAAICQSLGGLSQPTFDKYLTYLERAFLVFTLQNYSSSEESKQRRGRKLYFVDGAVRNAALQRGLAPLTDTATSEMGLLLENMVAGHLHALSQESQVRLYHWRNKQDEVDLVYDHPEMPLAFEVSMNSTHHRRGLLAFEGQFPRFRGRCYLVSPESPACLPADAWDGIGSIPLDLLLLAIGAHSEAHLRGRLRGKSSEGGPESNPDSLSSIAPG